MKVLVVLVNIALLIVVVGMGCLLKLNNDLLLYQAHTIKKLQAQINKFDEELQNTKKMMNLQDVKKIVVTAYSPRKAETDSTPYITASMTKVKHGIVAVSRDLFEQGLVFGKKVYIEGYGIYTIEDLMNERFTNRIDIFMFDTRKALKFGKKKLVVALLNK